MARNHQRSRNKHEEVRSGWWLGGASRRYVIASGPWLALSRPSRSVQQPWKRAPGGAFPGASSLAVTTWTRYHGTCRLPPLAGFFVRWTMMLACVFQYVKWAGRAGLHVGGVHLLPEWAWG